METLRIHRHVDSETLHLPELRPLIGKDVEIIVQEQAPPTRKKLDLSLFKELAGKDVVDPEAYKQLRANSMI